MSEELEERVRGGNVIALAEFAELHQGKMMAALERKVGAGLRRKIELEDIYQEVLTRAIRDLQSVDLTGQSPLGWLFTVMDRQIVDLHRYHFQAKKRDARLEVSVDAPAPGRSDGGGFADLLVASLTTPSAAMSRNLRLQRVHAAIEGLSDDMQKAIRWRYLEGLPSQEIAAKLGKSDVATRVLLSRAIRKLQASLAEKSV